MSSTNDDPHLPRRTSSSDDAQRTSSSSSRRASTMLTDSSFRLTQNDVEKLKQERGKEGRCTKCGDVQTHRKSDSTPQTVHGLVYKGVCLRCNPSPNLESKLSYGLGWERAIRVTDFKLRWEMTNKIDSRASTNNPLDTAYVRKVEFWGGGNNNAVRPGQVTLVGYEESVVDSVVECRIGGVVACVSDIEKAQQMKLKDKIEWFGGACQRLSMREGQAQFDINKGLLNDSVEAVMALTQSDLRKIWTTESSKKIGELLEQVFDADVGLWQISDMDETRLEINPFSAGPEKSKFFRFTGRMLGKALFDGQLVNIRLTGHLYKLLLGWPISSEDMKEKDCRYLRSLWEMRSDVANLGLHFTVSEDVFGLKTRVPLVPNGFNIVVHEHNLSEFLDSCFKHHAYNRYQSQLSEFILGFFEVIPEPLIAVFDFQEFESIICGSYTGAKTEENDVIDEVEYQHEVAEEIKHNIFNGPDSKPNNQLEQIEADGEVDGFPTHVDGDIVDDVPGGSALAPAVEPGAQPGAQPTQVNQRLERKMASGPSHPAPLPEPAGSSNAIPGIQCNPSPPTDTSQEGPGEGISVNEGRPLPPTGLASQNSEDSHQSLLPVAAEVVENVVYDAVQVDSVEERNRRISQGQCPTCGIQTHKRSGRIFKKRNKPLTNEHVLSGRCLLCNPIAQATQISTLNGSTSTDRRESASGKDDDEAEGGQLVDGDEDILKSPESQEHEPEDDLDKYLRMQAILATSSKTTPTSPTAGNPLNIPEVEGDLSNVVGLQNAIIATAGHDLNNSLPLQNAIIQSLSSPHPQDNPPNIATVFVTESNTKTVKCEHCSAYLFTEESGTSFTCRHCKKVSHVEPDRDEKAHLQNRFTADIELDNEEKSKTMASNVQSEITPPRRDTNEDISQHKNNLDADSLRGVPNLGGEGRQTESPSDDGLDMLARLVQEAAAGLDLQFTPNQSTVLPCDLHLAGPLNPSGLTLDSYFQRDNHSVVTSTLPEPAASERQRLMITPRISGGEFDTIRLQLINIVECVDQPIQLPPKYIETIKTKTKLGGGYYGDVRLGIDEQLGKRFALKLIKPIVFEQALSSQLESIQKSFKNEVQILSNLRHPNIAPLYGYCVDEAGLRNTSLLYELAINGSLDKFWAGGDDQNLLKRERLSDKRTRARIALEVAMVLRYMHECLDGGTTCFHRDIKSANVCVTADFSARVIDCGLAKYVTEEPGSFSTAGPTGTPGYTCPEYLGGEIRFKSACDVFSFGILISELISGKLSCRKAQHYSTYKKRGKRGQPKRDLFEDADTSVDWGNEIMLKKLVELALKCMRFESERRPSIGRVVRKLTQILEDADDIEVGSKPIYDDKRTLRHLSQQSSGEPDIGNEMRKCRVCGEVTRRFLRCSGSHKHVHCDNCLQNALKRNINRFRFGGLACLKDCCDSKRFTDDDVASLVSQDVWESYVNQRNSSLFQAMGKNIESNTQQIQSLLVQLTAGNGLPCPRRFILADGDRNTKLWHNPREWMKNVGTTKLYLYFVCSHSLEPVSDKCRIKIRYSRDWLRAIAPALNVSLFLINLSLNLFLQSSLPIDMASLKEMDEWVKEEILDPVDRDVIEEASQNGGMIKDLPLNLHTLVGNSLSHVAEKAASSNINWQRELVPVYDFKKKEPTFVMKSYASDARYQGRFDVFSGAS